MPGLARERLVLVKAVIAAAGGETVNVGTGYLVTADLVLTAGHVVPEDGLTQVEVRTELQGNWHTANLQPAWRDKALDALLLRLTTPVSELGEVAWAESDFESDAVWHSSAYPNAGKVSEDSKPLWKTVGLGGTLLALGGGGQGSRELELTVESPPPAEQWFGVSGAPVFVGDRLVGFIKEVPKSFQGGRLIAVPTTLLLQNHSFRLALSTPWLEPLPQGVWVLVVLCEAARSKPGLGEWVDGALAKDAKALESVIQGKLQPKALRVRITDAIESPGRWLRFVQALCAAPIAIFDATGFEPGVMLALGVRAVVRRGVTLTSTADELTPAHLSQLPFNIQETKLVHHGSGYAPNDIKHPLTAIPASIKRGWQELASQPNYLDLPAYDAVRCPYPAADIDGRSAVKRMLVLCAFAADHEPNWLHLSNALLAHYPDGEAVRMLDVTSPRLVGQALYEGIRWSRTCVVDWTGWRANVFFEFGVRIACADLGPVGLIAQPAFDALSAPSALAQLRLMIGLFGPAVYRVDADDVDPSHDAIGSALDAHDAIVNQRPAAIAVTSLPHDATFRTCRDRFEWTQEHITMEPHELLRSSIEAPFGKDRQAGGRSPLLFSSNADYSKDLDRSVKERWIAAWYYLAQRYPKAQWAQDRRLRAMLKRLGNDVLQFGLPAPSEAHLIALRDEIFDVIDELDDLDKQQTKDGQGHVTGD